MTWRRAAVLAIIPWALLLAGIFTITIWDGMPENYGWPNYLWRMSGSALLVYAGATWALHVSRPHVRKKP